MKTAARRRAAFVLAAALGCCCAASSAAHDKGSGKGGQGPTSGDGKGKTGLGPVFGQLFDLERKIKELRQDFANWDQAAERRRQRRRRSGSREKAEKDLDRAARELAQARQNADAGNDEAASASLLESVGSIVQAQQSADQAWRDLGIDRTASGDAASPPAPNRPPAPPPKPAPEPTQEAPEPMIPRIPKTPSPRASGAVAYAEPGAVFGAVASAPRAALEGDSGPAWLAEAQQAQAASANPSEARFRSGAGGGSIPAIADRSAPGASAPARAAESGRAGLGDAPRSALPPERASLVKPAVDSVRASLSLAQTAIARGDYAAAERHALAATAADPRSAAAYELLAWSQLKQGRYREALASANKAAELAPERARPLVLAALAHEKLGERRAALASIAEAAKRDARYKPALEAALTGKALDAEGLDDELFLKDLVGVPSRAGSSGRWLLLLLAGVLGSAAAWRGLRSGSMAAEAEEPEAGPSGPMGREKYELGKLLGRAGATEAWQARDRVLGREVAIAKRLVPQGDPARAEAVSQARRAASLRHPALLELYEVVEGPDDVWLVYEALRGSTLAELARREGSLSLERALELLDPVCRALEYTHANGLFHGALTSASIVLAEGGYVKLRELGGIAGADRAGDVAALASCLESLVGADSGRPLRGLREATGPADFLRRARELLALPKA